MAQEEQPKQQQPRLYTLEDLKQNTTEKSCYLLIHGKVYNVTDFLEEHPGGYDIILGSTGARGLGQSSAAVKGRAL
eukprot:1146367-Pelagomonas_calceolata.AAC.1